MTTLFAKETEVGNILITKDIDHGDPSCPWVRTTHDGRRYQLSVTSIAGFFFLFKIFYKYIYIHIFLNNCKVIHYICSFKYSNISQIKQYIVYNIYCALYSVYNKSYIAQYIVHCSVYTIKCTLYTVKCIMYYVLNNIQCILYTVHCSVKMDTV